MKFRHTLLLMFSVLVSACLLSCDLSSDSDSELSSDCIITSMTLGSLKRVMHTKNSLGQDSTYEVNVTGAYYPLTIDHLTGKIYNNDSLPYGTDLSRVVFNAVNASGAVVIRSLVSGEDTTFVASDSLDFTLPRLLTVYAADGVSKRDYEVKLNVHREEGDSTIWHNLSQGNAALKQMTDLRALQFAQSMLVFGKKGQATQLLDIPLNGVDVAAETEWEPVDLENDLLTRSIQQFGESLFAQSAAGELLTSQDGKTWDLVNTTFRPQALLASGNAGLVALGEGAFYMSLDGIVWNETPADFPEMMPQNALAGTCVAKSKDGAGETYVIVGKRNNESVVWRRWIDPVDVDNYPWINVLSSPTNAYPLPDMNNCTLVSYDGVTYMAGMTAQGKASVLYTSPDNGRSWMPGVMPLPNNEHLNTTGGVVDQTIAVDTEKFLWLISSGDGKVWRGRYLRLGWK